MCVYRERWAANVRALIDANAASIAGVALWALDASAPQLEGWTVGIGPGGRFELLTRCIQTLPIGPDAWLAIIDDDIGLTENGLDLMARFGNRVGLDLLQPAHAWPGTASYPYTHTRPWLWGRRGEFVEIGPVVMANAIARKLILPLESPTPMGYGADVAWAVRGRASTKLGVVDAVTVDHRVAPGSAYNDRDERAEIRRVLAENGLDAVADLQKTLHVWRIWSRDVRAE